MTGDQIANTQPLVGSVDFGAGVADIPGGQRLRNTGTREAANGADAAAMKTEIPAAHSVEKRSPSL
jgi:hypothetical protein